MAESRRPPDIKTNKKYLYHLILFVASIIIVVAVSPREGKFRYEFQKGKPWLSSSVIAPWDFPVLKPDYIVTHERDSILKNFAPYFKLDPEVEKKEIGDFDKYLNDLLQKYESASQPLAPMGFISVKRELNSILSEIYQRGVLENDESVSQEKLPVEITVVSGKIAEQRQVSTLFMEKSAYQFAEEKKAELEKQYVSGSGRSLSDFVSRIALYDFIEPNLIYDAVTSNAVKDKMIEEISINRGLIQEGELIISQGEIVNEDKFNILESMRLNRKAWQADKWLILSGRFILVSTCYIALYLLYTFRFDVLSST
jgi:membrane-associated HD superfamily phosphohydrolase